MRRPLRVRSRRSFRGRSGRGRRLAVHSAERRAAGGRDRQRPGRRIYAASALDVRTTAIEAGTTASVGVRSGGPGGRSSEAAWQEARRRVQARATRRVRAGARVLRHRVSGSLRRRRAAAGRDLRYPASSSRRALPRALCAHVVPAVNRPPQRCPIRAPVFAPRWRDTRPGGRRRPRRRRTGSRC